MKLNLATVQAALEEFDEQLADAVEQPSEAEELASDQVGEELGEQSTLIDNDSETIGNHIDQVSAVAERIESAPGEMDEPLDPNVQAGAQIALESLNVALEADEGETKEGLLAKLWRYIKQAFQVVRNFGKRVIEYVKSAWAYCTDRAVRNKRRAEKLMKDLNDKDLNLKKNKERSFKAEKSYDPRTWSVDVKLTPAQYDQFISGRVRKILNGANAVSLTKGLGNMLTFLKAQSRNVGKKEMIEIGGAIGSIADNPDRCDTVAREVLEALDAISSPGYKESSNSSHRKAVQAAEGTSVRVSEPFLGGYRAFVKVPSSINNLGSWGAGVAKLDEVTQRQTYEIPSKETIVGYVKLCSEVSDIVLDSDKHQEEMKAFDKILSKEISVGGKSVEKSDTATAHVRTVVSQMQSLIPRVIKGPSIDAVRLASEQVALVLDYAAACRNAYEEVEGARASDELDQQMKNATRFGVTDASMKPSNAAPTRNR